MAARKKTSVDAVAQLEKELAQVKAQLSKARTQQETDAQKTVTALT